VWEQNIPKLGIFSNTPPEKRSIITSFGKNNADYYIVSVVKNFNSKYAVLIFFMAFMKQKTNKSV
jgi:hypothetical protein